jgi:hypothetical protein
MHATLPICVIILDSSTLIIFGEAYKLPPLYAFFSILLPLSPSQVQIFSSALCSQTPSVFTLALVRETKFHTLVQNKGKLIVLYHFNDRFIERVQKDKIF